MNTQVCCCMPASVTERVVKHYEGNGVSLTSNVSQMLKLPSSNLQSLFQQASRGNQCFIVQNRDEMILLMETVTAEGLLFHSQSAKPNLIVMRIIAGGDKSTPLRWMPFRGDLKIERGH